MKLLSALALLLLVAVPASAPAAHWWEQGRALPSLTGRVVDDARLLTPEQAADLSQRLAGLEARTRHQFVVVTVSSLQGQSIEDFGVQLGRTWGVGRKGIDDGLILIVAPNERQVRIEVGYGLEKRLPDPLCARIIRETILPHFRTGDMAGGIRAGTLALIARIGNN